MTRIAVDPMFTITVSDEHPHGVLPAGDVRTCVAWLPHLGPTASWAWQMLWRTHRRSHVTNPDDVCVAKFEELATSIGVSGAVLRSALDRANLFGLINIPSSDTVQLPRLVRIPKEKRHQGEHT